MKDSFFIRYLFHIKYYIICLVITAAVFSLFSWLGGMRGENILYACILLSASFTVAAAIRGVRLYRKHMFLRSFLSKVGTSPDNLPEYYDIIDCDYAEIIAALNAALADTVSRSDSMMTEIKEYYALWAHQIKTPIAGMRLLLQTESTPPVGELSAELFKIEQYVEMVLQYIRSDSNSTDYLIESCSLDDIIRASLRKYAPSFIRKKLALHYEPLNLTVLTDAKWLGFVIEQLLSNALKYTQTGSISLTAEGQTLLISDTGIGIRPEDLPRVFDNSFTGYNGRYDRKSTGIGLYLSRRILTALGHTISVSSVLGSGTTVKIDLSREKITAE